MNQHVRDALVKDYEYLINTLRLPDPDDRHVLAAAIEGCCDIIITCNLKDFPDSILKEKRIKAQHPDEFLQNQFHLNQSTFLDAVKTVRMRLKNPPKTAELYLQTLEKNKLIGTVKLLGPYTRQI